ncbi:hypothetical protein IU427_20305 [Nocardia beijingensis]|uniref:hypothetical protein n=1 Tax=Nocardia beijingensis TaxID=95162 RepID=UPI0018941599|nr:hypothetical protein [Nocardia beijingensis]MBF6467509.1 hypothetical protein [Nocardia beijingensis]
MTELRAFRQACYDAARRTGGSVIEFRLPDGVTPNFYQAVIAYGDRHVAVVLLRDSAVLAIAEPRAIDPRESASDSGPLTFHDAPELADALAEQSGLEILTSSQLNGPFDSADWPEIDPDDVRYWKPQTLGEALFNFWD